MTCAASTHIHHLVSLFTVVVVVVVVVEDNAAIITDVQLFVLVVGARKEGVLRVYMCAPLRIGREVSLAAGLRFMFVFILFHLQCFCPLLHTYLLHLST